MAILPRSHSFKTDWTIEEKCVPCWFPLYHSCTSLGAAGALEKSLLAWKQLRALRSFPAKRSTLNYTGDSHTNMTAARGAGEGCSSPRTAAAFLTRVVHRGTLSILGISPSPPPHLYRGVHTPCCLLAYRAPHRTDSRLQHTVTTMRCELPIESLPNAL